MKYHVLTLFPEMIEQTVNTSITGRAVKNGSISLDAVDIRAFSENKHKRVDDYPYGGGAGMVIQAEPVYRAYQSIQKGQKKPRCIYLTPQGSVFSQNLAEELALEEELIFLCGHYEGVDERVLEEIVTDYVSIGDYVLTGGELAACVMIDAISRFVPGVLSNEESSQFESHQDHLLEYPHYTRPEVWHEKRVPEALLTGDHKKIQAWRLEQSQKRTQERRPDLLAKSRRVTAAYFSPTGGTKKSVQLLAGFLTQNPQYVNLTRRKCRKQQLHFTKQELLIAAAPVYMGQLPRVEEGLFTNLEGDATPCILLAAYGNRAYEDTLAQMKEILTKRGFICIGAIASVIPHVYSERAGKGRPDEADIGVFRKFAVNIKGKIEAQETKGFTEALVPGNPNPQPREGKTVVQSFYSEKCNFCHACVQKCPVHAIAFATLELDEKKCLHCMHCTQVCQKGARTFDAQEVSQYLEVCASEPKKVEVFL